jgi:hypothetical protein
MMEFLTSAWLWLIPILLGLRYWFNLSKSRFGRFGIGALLVIFGWKFLIASWGIVHPVRVEVVDQITGKPIAGVMAFAVWESVPLLPATICNGSRMRETDSNGEAVFRFAPIGTFLSVGVPGRVIAAAKTSMTFTNSTKLFYGLPQPRLVGGYYVAGSVARNPLLDRCAEQDRYDPRNYEKFESALDHVCGPIPFPPTDVEFNNLYLLHDRVVGRRFPPLKSTKRTLSVAQLDMDAYKLFASSEAGNLRPDNGAWLVRALDPAIAGKLCEAFAKTIVPNKVKSHE